MERSYGSFNRNVTLPSEVVADKTDALKTKIKKVMTKIRGLPYRKNIVPH